MKIQATEVTEILKRQIAGYDSTVDISEVGTVIQASDGIARMRITVEVDGLETLGRLFSRIQQLSNVIEVQRLRTGAKGMKRKGSGS